MVVNDEGMELPLEDLALLAGIQRGNEWLRAVLCTLARRGAAFRRDHQQRSELLLMALSRYPFFKAGQFLFDLMEWEDFMLDGPPPSIVPTTLDAASMKRLAKLIDGLREYIDGSEPAVVAEINETLVAPLPTDADLPLLEPSLYLYQELVLGVLCSARSLLSIQQDSLGQF